MRDIMLLHITEERSYEAGYPGTNGPDHSEGREILLRQDDGDGMADLAGDAVRCQENAESGRGGAGCGKTGWACNAF